MTTAVLCVVAFFLGYVAGNVLVLGVAWCKDKLDKTLQ